MTAPKSTFQGFKSELYDAKMTSLSMDIVTLLDKATKSMSAIKGVKTAMENGYEVPNYVQFEAGEDSFWASVKETVVTLLKKIREFFRMCMYKIRTFFMDEDVKDFDKYKYKLQAAMANGPCEEKINALKWKNPNTIVSDLISDILIVQEIIDSIYENSIRIVHALMDSQSEWEGMYDTRNKLKDCLNSLVDHLFQQLNIEDARTHDKYEPWEIREFLNKKYFENGEKDRKEIKLKDFIMSYDLFESAYSKESLKGIKRVCELMESGSNECQAIVDTLNRWSTQGFQKVTQEALNKVRDEITWDIITVSKLAHTLGQEYWILYFNLRNDLRLALRTYTKTSK